MLAHEVVEIRPKLKHPHAKFARKIFRHRIVGDGFIVRLNVADCNLPVGLPDGDDPHAQAGENIVIVHIPHRATRGFLIDRSEEHTSELQSLMRISYAVFCLKKKTFNDTDLTIAYQHTTQPYQNPNTFVGT